MTQNVNQFGPTPEKGQLDGAINWNLLTVKIDDSSVANFTNASGFALKIIDKAGEIPTVDLATAATDDVYGFLPYEIKTNSYVAGDLVRVAYDNSIMIMEASAAIASGASVEIVPTGNKVATQSAGTTIGRALEKATADGDLIKISISTK